MAIKLALVNQKGGVGKTTTGINMASCLAMRGQRVLLVDLDPQGNATSGLGFDKNAPGLTTYDVLINQVSINDVQRETIQSNLYLCPGTIDLAGAEIEMVSMEQRESVLKRSLNDLEQSFDYILIDSPPSLGILTLNALTACDGAIVPIQGEYYALEGVSQLMDTIGLVKAGLNPDLDIFGVVLTMYDSRIQLANQVNEEVRNYFGDKVFETIIPRNVRLSEAPSYGQPINIYDKKSKGGEAYHNLAREVMARVRKEFVDGVT